MGKVNWEFISINSAIQEVHIQLYTKPAPLIILNSPCVGHSYMNVAIGHKGFLSIISVSRAVLIQ